MANRSRKVVIVGGNACGMKTAARLRRRDPEAEITVVEKGAFLSYGACGFPYYISGMVPKHTGLMNTPLGVIRDADFFNTVKGVRVLTHTEAVRIDRQNKTVEAVDRGKGETMHLAYDCLVLATGGAPVVPEMEGRSGVQGVFTVSSMDDAIGIRGYIDQHEVEKVVIAGGGYIGMETTEGLADRGLQVTIIKTSSRLLPAMLDTEIQLLISRYMQQQGVHILSNDSVARLCADSRGMLKSVVTEKGTEVPADLLLVTKGIRPSVGLAREAGLELGETGGVRVGPCMQTSDPCIYAGGDCVENKHLLTGKKIQAAMGSIANLHGRVIADCIAGDSEQFPGVLGTGIFKIFDYTVAATGLTEQEAQRSGYEAVSSIVPGADKPHFYQGAKPIIIKLVADGKSGRVLGAQIFGSGDVAKRIEIVVTALTCGATVDQLSNLNLAYSPPFSPAIDNIITAAHVLGNKMTGTARSLSPLEVKQKFDQGDDFVYLDVRSPGEFERERIDHPSVVLLPLSKLRSEPPDIGRNAEIVVGCKSSLRAYEAQRILQAQGFQNVRFMDGGILAWPFDLYRS